VGLMPCSAGLRGLLTSAKVRVHARACRALVEHVRAIRHDLVVGRGGVGEDAERGERNGAKGMNRSGVMVISRAGKWERKTFQHELRKKGCMYSFYS